MTDSGINVDCEVRFFFLELLSQVHFQITEVYLQPSDISTMEVFL